MPAKYQSKPLEAPNSAFSLFHSTPKENKNQKIQPWLPHNTQNSLLDAPNAFDDDDAANHAEMSRRNKTPSPKR